MTELNVPGVSIAVVNKDGQMTYQGASTGMPRRDAEWTIRFKGITPEMRIAEMREMQPTTGYKETFQYSNLLYSAGGFAAAKAFRKDNTLLEAYEDSLHELVLSPLEMQNTFLDPKVAVDKKSAMPHGVNAHGELTRVSLETEGSLLGVAPAGALWSTASDLARYLVMELNEGRVYDRQYISKENLLERRRERSKISENHFYGLGIIAEKHLGLSIFGHDGNTFGFSSLVNFIPDKELGIVILTNVQGANTFMAVIREKIFELMFHAPVPFK